MRALAYLDFRKGPSWHSLPPHTILRSVASWRKRQAGLSAKDSGKSDCRHFQLALSGSATALHCISSATLSGGAPYHTGRSVQYPVAQHRQTCCSSIRAAGRTHQWPRSPAFHQKRHHLALGGQRQHSHTASRAGQFSASLPTHLLPTYEPFHARTTNPRHATDVSLRTPLPSRMRQ